MPNYLEFHQSMLLVIPPALLLASLFAAFYFGQKGLREILALIRLDAEIRDTWVASSATLIEVSYGVRGSVAANTHGLPSNISVTYHYNLGEEQAARNNAAAPYLCDFDLIAFAEMARNGDSIKLYLCPDNHYRSYVAPSSRRAKFEFIHSKLRMPVLLLFVTGALLVSNFI